MITTPQGNGLDCRTGTLKIEYIRDSISNGPIVGLNRIDTIHHADIDTYFPAITYIGRSISGILYC